MLNFKRKSYITSCRLNMLSKFYFKSNFDSSATDAYNVNEFKFEETALLTPIQTNFNDVTTLVIVIR